MPYDTAMFKAYTKLDIKMRKRDKIVLWPVYFDSTRTRLEGRRIPKRLAVSSPKLDEIRKAVERSGLHPETVPDAAYPYAPWRKVGFVVVAKEGSKTQIVQRVAKELQRLRAQT